MRKAVKGMLIGGLVFLLAVTLLQAQGARPEPSDMAALLAEVKGLRAEINEAASGSMRMQLLVARLSLQEQRITALSITHDMASARKIGDRIAMLYEGKLIWVGPAKDVDNAGNPYVDQFVNWGVEQIRSDSPYDALVLPGGVILGRDGVAVTQWETAVTSSPWHRFQMPGYHLLRKNGEGGVSLINIGVGSSNAKNITDHLAVLRPHCWLMIGHCGGLRQSQRIGDYVLAHAYFRQDRILDGAF